MCAAVSPNCGVDVCVDEDVLKKAPHCPHGPTLLFERFTPSKGSIQRYYACSACRDRKDCGFFQLHTNAEIVSDFKQQMREEYNRSRQPWKRQEDFYQRFVRTESLDEKERMFCYDCQLLVFQDEVQNHRRHQIKKGISCTELQRPSYLMDAIENNKTNAQYLFSSKAVKFLVQSLKALGFKRVLCVGVPRLHEYVTANPSSGLESLLFDIDHRFGQFYPPSKFCRYNMFNHFFLDGSQSEERCREFLTKCDGEGVVMVTDPPFGGMVDALASGVKWLMEMWRSNVTHVERALPVMWIFPYFLEHRILESLQGFKMLDYKVDYDNHPLFKAGPDAKKKGSPVRIFTNLDPSKIELPSSDGYRFCKKCQRYVATENVHCSKCESCPSKNGTTYTHCDQCNKCVKPSFVHCVKCNMCELPSHDCERPSAGCHVCGALDHKRRDCPKRSSNKKRSYEEAVSSDTNKLLTWPKRKKKTKPMVPSVLHHFRPAEEQGLGTPQATLTPVSSKPQRKNGVHSSVSSVSPSINGSPMLQSTTTTEDIQKSAKDITGTVTPSSSKHQRENGIHSSISSASPSTNGSPMLQGTPTTEDIQKSGKDIIGTVQPDISMASLLQDTSKVDGNDNLLEGSINTSGSSSGSSFSRSSSGLRRGSSLSSLRSIGSGGILTSARGKVVKLKNKKKKLMERIEKIRMKRKIRLKP